MPQSLECCDYGYAPPNLALQSFSLLKKIMCVGILHVYVSVVMYSSCKSKEQEPLQLELQVFVSCLMWEESGLLNYSYAIQ